jgi:RNA polymerase sigma factor (sigma-70 family)
MEFDTLETYTNIAKKTISKFAAKMYPSLVKEMLSNDETVSEIAEAIMIADWKWDSNKIGKTTGMSKNKYSYRNQCAIWAIKTYVTQKFRKNKKDQKKIDFIINNKNYVDYSDPAKIYANKEQEINLIHDVRSLIDNSPLSEKQKNQIILYYYDNKTLSEIGKIYNITREAVRQNIHKSINIIKSYVNQN